MKKTMLRGLCLLLTLALTLGGLFISPGAFAAVRAGDKIRFGTYPGRRVTDGELIASLEAAQKTWKLYGRETVTEDENGSLQAEESDIRFADFFFGGEKYRAVRFSLPLRLETGAVYGAAFFADQEDNGYFPGTWYFRYEPIVWRVLNVKTGLLLSERVLDAFVSPEETRVWLHTDFADTAFSVSQKKKLLVSSLNADDPYVYHDDRHGDETPGIPVYDRIFLLSQKQAAGVDYFASDMKRFATGTDYAACMGLAIDQETGGASWRLRTLSKEVGFNGALRDASDAPRRSGVRPVIRLSSLTENTETSEILYSSRARWKPGDVDLDLSVTAADARLALRAAVGLETYGADSLEFQSADVDFDGALTAADARLILRAAVGLELLFYSKFPDGVPYDVSKAEPEPPAVRSDYDVLRSGRFYLQAEETSSDGVMAVHMAMDGPGTFYSGSTVDGVSLGVLVRDGRVTLISDRHKTYTTPTDAELAALQISAETFTDMARDLNENTFPALSNADEIGDSSFGGKACRVYTFRSEDRVLSVYMKDLTLLGMVRIEGNKTYVMRVIKVSPDFPTLPPEGYRSRLFAAFMLDMMRDMP